MPGSFLDKLPVKGKKLWESAFAEAKKKYSTEKSAAIATAAVKKSFKKAKTGKYVAKSGALKLTLIKSGWFFPDYKFKIVISDDQVDLDGERVNSDLLQKLVSENRVDRIGDVDHEVVARDLGMMKQRSLLTSDEGTEGLYYLDDVKYDGGKAIATIGMNKKHKHYNKYIGLHKKGEYLYASAEFKNATISGNEIVNADSMGWTLTNNPRNEGAKTIGIIA